MQVQHLESDIIWENAWIEHLQSSHEPACQIIFDPLKMMDSV